MHTRKTLATIVAGAAIASASLFVTAVPASAVQGVTVASYPHLRVCEENTHKWDSPAVSHVECKKESESKFNVVVYYNE